MKICLVYEANNREFNNCVLLERELVRRGHFVKICNKTEDVVLFTHFDLVIIPNSYRSSDVDYYRYVFNPADACMIVYPCEQVVNRWLPDFYENNESNKVKHIPHLCWGQDYYNWIGELGYDMEKSAVVGAIQLDYCRPIFKSLCTTREQLAKKYGLNLNKKWMLFISDFVLMNELRFNQYINAGAIDRETLYARREFERKSKDAILQWLTRYAESNKDYQIIYRKHPVEILTEEMENIQKENAGNFFLISELNIKEWILNCDLVTTWNSTALVECYAANVKVGLLRPFDFSEEPKMKEYPFYRDYRSIKSYSEFETCMKNGVYEYNESSIAEINKLYSIESKPTFVRIADFIENKSCKRSNVIEKKYCIHRIAYLISHFILFKVFAKKMFQLFYYITGFGMKSASKRKMAVAEWLASVDNKKKKREFARKIDFILANMGKV